MPTAKKKETDPFPISPEQMKWPFRTEKERKKIIQWHKKQQKRRIVLEGVEEAPF